MDALDAYTDSLAMIEDVRAGLQSLDDEEENLIILKSHLAKIKKIREEQIRKDGLIATLKQRIAVLENEQTAAHRQHFEMEEILSERIAALENQLRDKNELQFNFEELHKHAEQLQSQKEQLMSDLQVETNRFASKSKLFQLIS